MKRLWSSFTVRLVVATMAWTAGLLYVAHVVSVYLMFGGSMIERFGHRLLPTLALAVLIMIAGAIVLRGALRTFRDLRRRLIDVQEGRERIIAGQYVSEVQPVVNTLNALLAHQERRVRDALARAGDLAHGLKTPLAVLSHEAARARAEGHDELAETLVEQVERMRRHIEFHLAHARAAASGATPGAHCSVAASAQALIRTLARLHAHRGLVFETSTPDGHVVRVQREDLDEMLGNLLDNACKWARSRVLVSSSNGDGRIVIAVEDDGSGIPGSLRDAVLQRGVRADEAAPGSGFGLAIVRELAALYGGAIALDASPLGGLRAQLDLPQATAEHSGGVQVH
jgi:signal transduction histidine kinase